MSNLTQLNSNLFDLFERVKSGNVDLEKAKVLNITAGNIIKNAKTQLDALRLSDNLGIKISEIIPAVDRVELPAKQEKPAQKPTESKKKPESKSMRQLLIEMDDFAVQIGYRDRLDAIVSLKEKGFKELFDNRNNS
jgi:hypothetical protein